MRVKCYYNRNCPSKAKTGNCNYQKECNFQYPLNKRKKAALNISVKPNMRNCLIEQAYQLHILNNNKSKFINNEAFKAGIGVGIDELLEILKSQVVKDIRRE